MLQSTIELTLQVMANTERCKIFIADHENGLRETLIQAEQTADRLKEQLEEISKALSSDQGQEQMRQPVITFLK
jgi:CHASE3 domain sensor protein